MRPLRRVTSVASIPMSVDLPAPFGPSRPEDVAAARRQRHAGDGATPAEMARDVGQLHPVEVEAHAARPAPPPGSGLVSSESSAPYTCSSALTSSSRRDG